MGISTMSHDSGIAEIVVDAPPVNALTARGWHDLAAALLAAGRDAHTRVVVLRAEGRGFNAGVDIKEMQATDGHAALIGANRGCYAAFAAVYECEVPVIAAVHGFCLGGGVGLAGNADIVVAAEDAYFGLPEVDRGALGAATHLARLVPQHLMRAMVYTCRNVTAAELLQEGPVQSLLISRSHATGVVEVPDGAHFTTCEPDRGRDESFQRAYAEAAGDPGAWAEFRRRFLAGDEAAYQAAVRQWREETS
jgi:enoyl-CoA hydratase